MIYPEIVSNQLCERLQNVTGKYIPAKKLTLSEIAECEKELETIHGIAYRTFYDVNNSKYYYFMGRVNSARRDLLEVICERSINL